MEGLAERVLEKASDVGHVINTVVILLAIVILYAIALVSIVAVFVFLSVMATLLILMPFAIGALIVIIVTEIITYFWTVAPGGDGLVINLYAGIAEQGVNGGAGGADGQDSTTNGRGDADNGRGWLRWWIGWWWWVAIVAVASYFLLVYPM